MRSGIRRITFLLSVTGILLLVSCSKSAQTPEQGMTTDSLPVYDSVLAKRLGADDYGMKPMVMVYLKKGPVRNQDSATAAEIQKGHMANIEKLARERKLLLAGPFLDEGEVRGIFIFDVPTVEEARKLTETDPAVQSGRLIMELHPWYGSAALVLLDSLHRKLQKKSF
ncbi:MAG: YciI family protein [Bacteroidales bacterium]